MNSILFTGKYYSKQALCSNDNKLAGVSSSLIMAEQQWRIASLYCLLLMFLLMVYIFHIVQYCTDIPSV